MALHTRKEFLKITGIESKHFSTYVSRGKIILLGDGMIDDSDPRNNELIPRIDDKKETELSEKPIKNKSLDKYDLDIEKKQLDIEKIKVDTRLQELKEEKIRGEVIPVTLVTTIFKAHSQSIVSSQKDFIEFLLIQVSKEARLTGDQLAKLRGKMVIGLNEAVDKSIASSKRNLKSLINEYSIARGVGEHE